MAFRHPPLVRFRTCFDALSGAYRIPLHLIYTMYISRDYQYMFFSISVSDHKVTAFFLYLQSPFWSFFVLN